MRELTFISCSLAALVLLAGAPTAVANPVYPYFVNNNQDAAMGGQGPWHELGDGFPTNELIESVYTYTTLTACTGQPYDDPGIPNVLVVMTNLTTTNWYDVHYVADRDRQTGGPPMPPPVNFTSISNYDGRIGNIGLRDDWLAFRIDHVGMNQPLIFESKNWDNVFEVGETWHFILQDFVGIKDVFSGLPGPPTPFGSLGIASNSPDGSLSTGSIIAVPEPTTLSLIVLSGLAMIRRRRTG